MGISAIRPAAVNAFVIPSGLLNASQRDFLVPYGLSSEPANSQACTTSRQDRRCIFFLQSVCGAVQWADFGMRFWHGSENGSCETHVRNPVQFCARVYGWSRLLEAFSSTRKNELRFFEVRFSTPSPPGSPALGIPFMSL
jgi:hypothetical protein